MDLVDIAGVLGFVLSLLIVMSRILASRLKIKVEDIVFIDDQEFPKSVFISFFISNRIKLPFSLISISLKFIEFNDVKKFRLKKFLCGCVHNVSISPVVLTYSDLNPTKDKYPVKPVILSSKYPLRFDSYDALHVLIEVDRQHGSGLSHILHQQARSPKEPGHPLFRRIRNIYTRQPLPLLVLNTSRGRREACLCVSAVEDRKWLEAFAVRKAALEGKVIFPK